MASDDLNESLSEVEAVMRLLEEKERDLELAARIGQTLLADNRKLKVRALRCDTSSAKIMIN